MLIVMSRKWALRKLLSGSKFKWKWNVRSSVSLGRKDERGKFAGIWKVGVWQCLVRDVGSSEQSILHKGHIWLEGIPLYRLPWSPSTLPERQLLSEALRVIVCLPVHSRWQSAVVEGVRGEASRGTVAAPAAPGFLLSAVAIILSYEQISLSFRSSWK